MAACTAIEPEPKSRRGEIDVDVVEVPVPRSVRTSSVLSDVCLSSDERWVASAGPAEINVGKAKQYKETWQLAISRNQIQAMAPAAV